VGHAVFLRQDDKTLATHQPLPAPLGVMLHAADYPPTHYLLHMVKMNDFKFMQHIISESDQ
jgi:hypothetical protein